MWLQFINKVKLIHQGEGHIKVKVKYLHPFKFYVTHALCKRVVCIRLKCYLLGLKFTCRNACNNSRLVERIPSEKQVEASRPRGSTLTKFTTCFREHSPSPGSAHFHQVRKSIFLEPSEGTADNKT